MRRELMTVMPPIVTFPNLNTPLAIAYAHEETHEWFFNRMVQLFGMVSKYFSFHGNFIDGSWQAGSCPFITRNEFTRSYVDNNYKSILDFIIHYINAGYYVYAYLDRYYNEKSENYLKKHKVHQLFISGYDTEKEVVIGADFFYGKYNWEEVSFEAVMNGYLEYQKAEIKHDYFDTVAIYAYKENVKWEFNLEILIKSMEDYLQGQDSTKMFYYTFSENEYQDFCYGVKYYNILRQLIIMKKWDKRAFHILYEHKKVMLLRLTFLYEKYGYYNNDIYAAYEEMEKMSIVIRNLVIKNQIKNDAVKCNTDQILRYLDKIEKKERVIMQQLIEGLIEYIE